jgi:type I restriction enzyme S subunit
MSDTNVNRPGYEETKVGWIPVDWSCLCLKDLGRFLKGSGITKSDLIPCGVPAVRYGDIYTTHDITIREFVSFVSDETSLKATPLEYGDLVFASSGETVEEIGKCAAVLSQSRCVAGGDTIIFRPSTVNSHWLAAFLNSNKSRRELMRVAQGQSVVHVYESNLKNLFVAVPSLEEQKVIATILAKCDELIDLTANLKTAKKQQKKALMQKLLTGNKRLPGFDGEWDTVVLDEICTRLRDVAENPEAYPVLSITARTGFVSQQEKFSRVIAGKQVEMYVLLKRGDFAYNKGNSYLYPQGCVYQLSEYDEGLVPNVFYSFRLNGTRADAEFIKQYFIAGLHNKNLYRWINSGVRNNGLLNLNASDFFKLPIDLPPLQEQSAIGSVLRDADIEIKKLESKLILLKQQKKSLMQKLLTGQLRVKI